MFSWGKHVGGCDETRTSSAASDPQVAAAQELAVSAHAGQVDKQGADYIEHVRAVADGVGDDPARAVAWLHDTVEDTPVTFDDLRARGFSDEVIAAVDLVTRDKATGLTYKQWIAQLAQADGEAGRLARAVKRSDLKHNMSRPTPPEMAGIVEKRYVPALKLIEQSMRDRGEL